MNKLQRNLNQNSYFFIQENAFKNVVRKTAAILSLPQWVNKLSYHDVISYTNLINPGDPAYLMYSLSFSNRRWFSSISCDFCLFFAFISFFFRVSFSRRSWSDFCSRLIESRSCMYWAARLPHSSFKLWYSRTWNTFQWFSARKT